MNSEIELRDHVLVGPLRRSVNNARNVSGSIHDDAMATKLGFAVAPSPDRYTWNCFRRSC